LARAQGEVKRLVPVHYAREALGEKTAVRVSVDGLAQLESNFSPFVSFPV